MGFQPSHWLVQWTGGSPYGNNRTTQVVVITDTKEQATQKGALLLDVPESEVTVSRFTSGAPAGGSS